MNEKDLLPSGSAALPLPEPVEVPSEEAIVPSDQDVDVAVSGGSSPDTTDTVGVSGGDAEASPGGFWIYIPGEDVSGSNLEPVSSGDVPVSGGDAGGPRGSVVTLQLSETVDIPDYPDYSAQLDDIVGRLDAFCELHSEQVEDIGAKIDACGVFLALMASLMLFYWCHARIRNAVRSFTGRNAIDD